MDELQVGQLNEDSDITASGVSRTSQKSFQEAYRKLGQDLRREGMFDASPMYYVRKVTEVHALLGVSALLAYNSNGSYLAVLASSVFCALMMQQAGWLSHDFLHHQVFEDRRLGNFVGLWLGNFLQGYSVSWWKDKHNSHHAVPNLITSSPGAKDGDPDIDTLPLLAWSRSMLKQVRLSRGFIGILPFCLHLILFCDADLHCHSLCISDGS